MPALSTSRFAELLGQLTPLQGYNQTRIPGVVLMRSDRHIPRSPVIYDPRIVIVAQGQKTGYLGNETYRYDPDNYLVLAVPIPFECETFGTPKEPMLAMKISVDPALVTELLLQMDDEPLSQIHSGIAATHMDDPIRSAAIRLTECLPDPMHAKILGPQLVREIVFRVLCGPTGQTLRGLAARHSHFDRVSKALRRIHEDCAQPFEVEHMARELSMSVSSFHHSFKAVTANSPLQYVKMVRLHRARTLMVQEGLTASSACAQVGYESPSQFSREFKRFFGLSPTDEVARMRRAT